MSRTCSLCTHAERAACHAAEAILEGQTPRSDGENGLRIVRILEAADASLAAGGSVVTVG